MISGARIPVLHGDDAELIGYVTGDGTSWVAQTIFGYGIARTETEAEAVETVRSEGRRILRGTWRYYDEQEHDWFPCVLKEVYEHKVVVTRTNDMGFEDASRYKLVVIKNPNESNLQTA